MPIPAYKIPLRSRIGRFVKSNAVFVIAFCLALVSSFFVPPDEGWASYFDLRTLTCLFCTLAVIAALKNIRFFTLIARRIVALAGNTRTAVITLVSITFIGSMLIANDMALLTFLPLGYFVLTSTGKEKYMAFTFVMQNIAANLGGMLTPFGNPQNLYLYSRFSIPDGEFFAVMFPPFLCAVLLILLLCFLFVRPEPLSLQDDDRATLPPARTALYLALFAFSLIIVFRLLPYWVGLILVPLVLLFADRRALLAVDYPLLLTFTCFFIFAGNVSRIAAVQSFFAALLDWDTLLVSIFSCQCLSNVPSAILLSAFTDNYRDLLLGVNIGGTGTLIASLASLITFRAYVEHNPKGVRRYLFVFTLLNLLFLAVLIGLELLLRLL